MNGEWFCADVLACPLIFDRRACLARGGQITMRKSILFLAICLLVSTEGFAESVSRESTNGVKGNQEVAKAVHKALVAGSVEGLNVALPTQAQLSEWCPTVKKPLSQYVLNLTETLGRCSQSRDWAHATLKSVSGGRKRPTRDKACPGIDIGQNIVMTFSFPDGETTKVKVDNPLVGAGRIFVLSLGDTCQGNELNDSPDGVLRAAASMDPAKYKSTIASKELYDKFLSCPTSRSGSYGDRERRDMADLEAALEKLKRDGLSIEFLGRDASADVESVVHAGEVYDACRVKADFKMLRTTVVTRRTEKGKARQKKKSSPQLFIFDGKFYMAGGLSM